jgi:hypothetical protein
MRHLPSRIRRRLPSRRRCEHRLALVVVETLEERLTLTIFPVTTTVDGGAGSLRQAILDANAMPGPDTIVFDTPYFSTARTIVINAAPPQIGGPLTIAGPGASLLTIQRTGGGLEISRRAFDSVASSLALSGMTVTGGAVSGANGGGLQAVGVTPNITLDGMVFTGNMTNGLGGAVYVGNGGTLTVHNCVISGNSAANGGGIYFFSGGSLILENSTITGNAANAATSAAGGGLYFFGAATVAPPPGFVASTLLVRGSTIDHNTSAGVGGGVALATFSGTLLMQDSTISGNTAATSGGGISAAGGAGAVTIQNSTVTQNTANGSAAGAGGGLSRTSTFNNTVTIINSVVSGNVNANAPDIAVDPFATTHVNFSAIGSSTGFTLAPGSGNNLPFGTNLMLGALAFNGGLTQTHGVPSPSPLVNAGSNAGTPAELATDQRGPGYARASGGVVDIGAFERTAFSAAVISSQFVYQTAPHRLRVTFDRDVAPASVLPGDLSVYRLPSEPAFVATAVSYDAASRTATYTLAPTPLPDGNYRATLLQGLHVTDFFVFAGDANHDRGVNFNDLVPLAQHYNAAGTFVEGDYNYDGVVDFNDLVIVAQRYNAVLTPPPAPAPVASARVAKEKPKAAFSTTPVARSRPAAAKERAIARPRAR